MAQPLLAFAAALLLAACGQVAAPQAANAAQEGIGAVATAPAAAADFPELGGRVVDEAGLLTAGQEAELTRRLEALERTTTDQLVIVTVRSLGGRSIADYTRELGNHWGVGREDVDNGVILLVAPGERQTRIGVGLGLEHVLTNEEARQIIDRDLLPRFRRSEWSQAIEAGARSIALELESQASTPRGQR